MSIPKKFYNLILITCILLVNLNLIVSAEDNNYLEEQIEKANQALSKEYKSVYYLNGNSNDFIAAFEVDNSYILIDLKSLNILFNQKFDTITPLKNGEFLAGIKNQNNKYNYYKVDINKNKSFIGTFDNVIFVEYSNDNLNDYTTVLNVNNKSILLNLKTLESDIIINEKFDTIKILNNNENDEFIAGNKNQNNKYNYYKIDVNKNKNFIGTFDEIIDFKYFYDNNSNEYIKHIIAFVFNDSNNYSPSFVNNCKYILVDLKSSSVLFKEQFDTIITLNNNEFLAGIKNQNDKYDYYKVDTDKNKNFIGAFDEIIEADKDGYFYTVKGHNVNYKVYDQNEFTINKICKYGILDKNLNILSEPIWEMPYGISSVDNYIIVQKDSTIFEYIKGLGDIGNGKYGCISKDGNIIIEPVYDNLSYLGNNIFNAVKDNKNFTIDLNNK